MCLQYVWYVPYSSSFTTARSRETAYRVVSCCFPVQSLTVACQLVWWRALCHTFLIFVEHGRGAGSVDGSLSNNPSPFLNSCEWTLTSETRTFSKSSLRLLKSGSTVPLSTSDHQPPKSFTSKTFAFVPLVFGTGRAGATMVLQKAHPRDSRTVKRSNGQTPRSQTFVQNSSLRTVAEMLEEFLTAIL